MDIPLFISRWFRQPRKMGSIWPSSKTLARRIANLVDIGNAPLVVELGPGIGPLTDALLAQGVSAQNLYLIEKDVVLVDHLRERFPMAAILTGDARDIQNLLPHLKTRVDYVVSGLPLLAMPEAVREEIFTAAMGMMKEG
ncbi:MAG: class I SAM-dependent methyltransferase, partial [Dongiaceae bacterium]